MQCSCENDVLLFYMSEQRCKNHLKGNCQLRSTLYWFEVHVHNRDFCVNVVLHNRGRNVQ